MEKVVELVGGGSVINGGYPVLFFKGELLVPESYIYKFRFTPIFIYSYPVQTKIHFKKHSNWICQALVPNCHILTLKTFPLNRNTLLHLLQAPIISRHCTFNQLLIYLDTHVESQQFNAQLFYITAVNIWN